MGHKAERLYTFDFDMGPISDDCLDAIYGKGKRPSDELVECVVEGSPKPQVDYGCDYNYGSITKVVFAEKCPDCLGLGFLYCVPKKYGGYADEVKCEYCGGSGSVISTLGMRDFKIAMSQVK